MGQAVFEECIYSWEMFHCRQFCYNIPVIFLECVQRGICLFPIGDG